MVLHVTCNLLYFPWTLIIEVWNLLTSRGEIFNIVMIYTVHVPHYRIDTGTGVAKSQNFGGPRKLKKSKIYCKHTRQVKFYLPNRKLISLSNFSLAMGQWRVILPPLLYLLWTSTFTSTSTSWVLIYLLILIGWIIWIYHFNPPCWQHNEIICRDSWHIKYH